MSLIIALIVDDHHGYKDLIFSSDGRTVEHGSMKIRREDFDKVKKLSHTTCIGYVGGCGELYEEVFVELSNILKKSSLKDLLFVSNKLRQTILKKIKLERFENLEKEYGPLNHQFIIGGIYNKKLRIDKLFSSNNFQIRKHDYYSDQGCTIEILGSSDEVQKKIKVLCEEKLGHKQTDEEIIKNLRFIISKIAEDANDINNHIFIRRLSQNFELESFIGYD